jgi:hypothetical protein
MDVKALICFRRWFCPGDPFIHNGLSAEITLDLRARVSATLPAATERIAQSALKQRPDLAKKINLAVK